ncbi:MAG: hypothetical protein QM528_04685 [Phycisphaerales bacterium]|nr:hypothetical protein [Phycisphaerales bacterium]
MRFIRFFTFVLFSLLLSMQSFSQAFTQDARLLSLGIGGSNFSYLPNNYARLNFPAYYNPSTGQFNLQMEFGIHKYIGVGLTTGFGFSRYEFNVPLGFIGNFHFYQLIADHSKKDIAADKLDIYVGANIGTGIAAQFFNRQTYASVLIYGGPQVGLRYYATDQLAINLEGGFGKSWLNAGITLNLVQSKQQIANYQKLE